MPERTTHRTYCRICIAACGLEVDVEDGVAVMVRGDAAHPLSAGYTCSKGRALPRLHHSPDRLDRPRLRVDGDQRDATWDEVLADLDHRLADVVQEHGADHVGFFLGGGIYMDTAGYWSFRRLARRLPSGHVYSDTTIDSAAKYRVMELVAGTYSLMPHVDPEARLVVMLGTNPVVSHGQTPMFEDPVQRMRRTTSAGEVWVVDPRTTETSRLASRHLAIRPGTDHALLAWLVRELLADGGASALLADRVCNLDALTAAVTPFTLDVATARTGLTAAECTDLLAAVRRAGRIAVLTGTGVTMSPGGNVAEWLVWALLTVTDSFDQPGGMWCNPGFLARLDERDALPGVGPPRPGPPTHPGIAPLMGEWPAAVIPAEIEAGNLRALVVLGGNVVTALPDTERVVAALERLDVLVTVDVAHTPTTTLATHVLPTHAQLERSDLPLLNDLYNSTRMMQYTRAVLPAHPDRRSGWWVLARIAASLGVAVLPDGLDPDTTDDETVLDCVAGPDTATLRAADPPWRTAPSPVHGWVLPRLADTPWDLAPAALVDQLAGLADPPALQLIPRRMPKRFNGRPLGDGGRAELLVHPDDAAGAGVAEGDLVEVSTPTGTLVVPARLTEALRPGAVSISHGWADANVNRLISSDDLDPLTGMPRMSGTAVALRRVGRTTG